MNHAITIIAIADVSTQSARRTQQQPASTFGVSGMSANAAFLLYLTLTIGMTWPLAIGIARDVPGDFGDPLFTSWVLSWDATHLGPGWWSANIFAPQRLTLAYSEHFLPQALQTLPIYAATQNPILCYNLLFLSTFVLSGVGMFLLGRELTGSAAAGFAAGMAFAFAPYRMANIPHLQVLSAEWMPFVLFGLHRYFATGRVRPLAGAAAAWLVQNLSCGYYLLFFSPIVVIYIGWELWRRGLWRDARTMMRVAAAVAIVLAFTAPFLFPYLELRRLGFAARTMAETRRFSADVYAYFTADPNLWLWGPMAQAWPRAEGLLFPGLTTVVLAFIGAAHVATAGSPGPTLIRQRPIVRVVAAIGALIGGLMVVLLLGFSIRLPGIKITSLSRVLLISTVGIVLVLTASKSCRDLAARWLQSPAGIFTVIVVFAVAMSFGPAITAKGREVAGSNIYALFMSSVPGFDGVRVPAGYAMIATLGLAALTALGIAAFEPQRRRRAAVVAAALILVEAIAVPIPINQNSADYRQRGLAPLPDSIAVGSAAPEVYRFAAQLPESAVLLELPVGEPAFDVRYMFYSTLHWRRLVNGYSGGAPPAYALLTEALKDREARPDR